MLTLFLFQQESSHKKAKKMLFERTFVGNGPTAAIPRDVRSSTLAQRSWVLTRLELTKSSGSTNVASSQLT